MISCNKCHMTFTNKYTLQRHLDKKIPCKIQNIKTGEIEIKKISLQIQKEKIEERKSKMLLENKKLELKREQLALDYKKVDVNLEIVKIKKDQACNIENNKCETQEKIAEIKRILDIDKQKMIKEIELIKSKRQIEKNDNKMVNNHINITKNTNIYVNNLIMMDLENKYLRINKQNMSNMDKLIQNSIEKVTVRPHDSDEIVKKKTRNKEDILDMASKPTKIFDHIIRDTFMKNNKNIPLYSIMKQVIIIMPYMTINLQN